MSILLPFYNAASTLNQAVDSIVNQSLTDWELILVDNASTDGSSLLAEKWAKRDSRIQLIRCERKGIAHALNQSLELVNSDFIARMDADDVSYSDRFERQLNFLKENPEIGVVSCQADFQSSLEKAEGYAHFVNWQNGILSPDQHWINRFKESPVAHPTVLFRTELIRQFGSYSVEPIPEDYELWLRWMENGVRFAKIPEKLFLWTDSADRLSRNNANYSEEAFFKVKGRYLSSWMNYHVESTTKVVACGTSKECRQRATWLMEAGMRIDYLTDVVSRSPDHFEFLPVDKITSSDEYFVINLIGKRGVAEEIENYFTQIGFNLGQSLLHLA